MTVHGQDAASAEQRAVNASNGMAAAVSELVRVRAQLRRLVAAHPSGTVPTAAVSDVLAGSNGRYRA